MIATDGSSVFRRIKNQAERKIRHQTNRQKTSDNASSPALMDLHREAATKLIQRLFWSLKLN
jgi:hypothetical protein